MSAPAKKAQDQAETNSVKPSVIRNNKPQASPAAKPKLSVVSTAVKAEGAETKGGALDKLRTPVLLCDLDWTIVYANDTAYDVLALMEPNLHAWNQEWKTFSAAHVVGKSLDFLFTDEPIEFKKATDPRNHPYRRNIQTGPCTCDVIVDSVRDAKGNLAGFLVDWERITDKLASELRTDQLLTVLENATTNTFLCDLNWKVIYANKRSAEVLQLMEPNLHKHDAKWASFKANEILGNSISWLFTDEPEEFAKVGEVRNHPYNKVLKTGPCVCDVSITGTYDRQGKLSGYAVSWERITDRVAAEKRAKQLMTALEGSSVCVMLVDAELRTIYQNQMMVKNLKAWEPELQKVYGAGFSADNLMGKCIDEFHKNPAHQRKLLANESIFPYRTQIVVGPLTIDLAVNIIKGDAGETLGYCTEWNDISERLQVESDYKSNVKEIADRMEFLRAACSTDLALAMEALAAGDLTVTITPRTPLLEIPSQPDLALMAETFNALRNQTVKAVEAYNQARGSLGEVIAQAQLATTSIADAASEVMTGNDDLAQRTEEQASSLEETASSMEEMTSTVKQNADNAKQANQLAMQARESAEKGGQVVNNAVSTMEEINVASRRIADIISVIDEIAFQTNLLALNAAVEAARVGEQGRGFAVVAAEVRNLAGRSATAAKEIKGLVQDSVQKVQEGSGLVNQSGAQLDEIVTSVKKVADIIAEISAAAQEQSAGIEQVNRAIVQMDQITQQNAALVEEASAASQSMHRQAGDLQTVIDRFTVDPEFMKQLQAKAHAEAAAAASQAKKASRAQSRPVRTSAAKPITGGSLEDLDEFEEF